MNVTVTDPLRTRRGLQFAHILRKLRLRDRAQAVVYAYENGVVAPGES